MFKPLESASSSIPQRMIKLAAFDQDYESLCTELL
jgi:hypothetical protein